MSRLTRDGTAEPVSRGQIFRRERGQGNIYFPCSADHKQDWQPYPVDPYSCYMYDHTYIHTYTRVRSISNASPCSAPAAARSSCFHKEDIQSVVIPFILDVRLVYIPAGVTQEERHTGYLHLTSAVLALIFLARRIQPFFSLVDREVEFCALTN